MTTMITRAQENVINYPMYPSYEENFKNYITDHFKIITTCQVNVYPVRSPTSRANPWATCITCTAFISYKSLGPFGLSNVSLSYQRP